MKLPRCSFLHLAAGGLVQKLVQHPDVYDDLLLAHFFQWPQAAVDLGRKRKRAGLSHPIFRFVRRSHRRCQMRRWT
jgi:hypothetical protein